jgi:hypothetical protein
MPQTDLRAARANRVFWTDEKHIRPENTVTVNTKQSVGVLYKIADCVRTVSRPCAIGDQRGQVFVRAKSQL